MAMANTEEATRHRSIVVGRGKEKLLEKEVS
jgi:hypothetical protein